MVCYTENVFSKEFLQSQVITTIWQYFGGFNGMFRVYPGFPYKIEGNTCEELDPRTRPWYVSATTGAKNIILIIDTSGSMNNNSPARIEIARQAAISVINTLGIADWAGLVQFNTKAETYSPNLQRATKDNKNKMIAWINKLFAQGATNYEDAIKKTYDMFKNTVADD